MPTVTETRLASVLRISVMRLARRLRAERPDNDLTLSQISALAAVERHGPVTLGSLAARERVQPPSMTRIVGVLSGRGLVTRGAHASDGRQVVIAITDAGVALLREDRRRREAWLAQQLRDLTADEIAVLAAAAPILERLASS